VLSSLAPGAAAHEAALTGRMRGGLAALGATVHTIWPDAVESVGIVSFSLPGTDAALLAAYLSAEHGIGVRDGRFCAHPLFARLGIDRAVRASLGLGSSSEDVDRLIGAVETFMGQGPSWSYQQSGGGWQPVPDSRPMPDALPGSACTEA
jgi:selenocysteine lyase/cysteine desulfurase